jgi:hypothetical protein
VTECTELGVTQVAERIHSRLRRYLEAQYHIRDAGLIEERRILLEEPGGVAQRPFIEVTPSYATGGKYSKLSIPPRIQNFLDDLSEWTPPVGVFPPYFHQADALENFFADGDDGEDLIVATGTGSGKTETFLYAILSSLLMEAAERPDSFKRYGVRSLLLYPMNALVSDQISRLRRMFGDDRLAGYFRQHWGRTPRFGMYTSRTPYPGVRTSAKDQRHVAPILKHYESLVTSDRAEDKLLVKELKDRGRWPAKDIVSFFASHLEEEKSYQSGKRKGKTYTKHKWNERFITQIDDRELLTRHEIQEHVPDILVTNYSMLEYMLLRPIERSIFNQTKAWLHADKKNQLLLILDEAHMYRGVAGAEVALLIRRLMSRLDVSRDRFRCILTSASLGTGAAAENAGKAFAQGLTGKRSNREFAVVRGTREQRAEGFSGSSTEALILSRVDSVALAAADIDFDQARSVISSVATGLGWPDPPEIQAGLLQLRQYVTSQLTGFGPLELLIEKCSGNSLPFQTLSGLLFPSVSQDVAEQATNGLLGLGCFARRIEPKREEQPLIPTRVHSLFRGLPSIHACLNPKCTSRRHRPAKEMLLGRLFTEPHTKCSCGCRVFEVLTHRDCGAAYLRAFGTGENADFLWHEQGGTLTNFGRPLHELHVFIEEPHPQMLDSVKPILIDITTGRLVPTSAAADLQTRLAYLPVESASGNEGLTTFSRCPFCMRRTKTGNSLKIMDLATKGEQPFANLIREQFVCQPPTRKADHAHPNQGRKTLLFSDGRQKAARLARDLPREVERDSFREALVLAIAELKKFKAEAVLDENLFAAFVSVCSRHNLHFFDGQDQDLLLEECNSFRKHYDEDLDLALDSEWRPKPPTRYRLALLRQIADRYYSLTAACAAVVHPRDKKLHLLHRQVGALASPETVNAIALAWTSEMLAHSAFDPSLSRDARVDEFEYFEPITREEGLKRFFNEIKTRSGLDGNEISTIRSALFEIFTREGPGSDSGRLLLPDCFRLELSMDDTWLQCSACGHLQMQPLFGACANCGEKRLEDRSPQHPYMVARKDFFRSALRGVLKGDRPVHVTAEEHTAQLSQRDAGDVYATTEEFELRFQDVPLGHHKPPVDVLSCTTTMEVGVDIGSLTAVGLRTVPPQRENYQQRAGRAGRRGTSVSTVITYAQGGAHDAHYFANPDAMISGPPREPRIKSDNKRLARRHIHSHLLQTFFHSQLDKLTSEQQRALVSERPNLLSAFGTRNEFFTGVGEFTYGTFKAWVNREVLIPKSTVVDDIARWLPDELVTEKDKLTWKKAFVKEVTERLLISLVALAPVIKTSAQENRKGDEEDNDFLIDLLFDSGLLPSYAFPTNLCSFVIQEWDGNKVRLKERPQLGKSQALSEYAPGRLLVVNKLTYRIGGVFVEGSETASPATALFNEEMTRYIGCRVCPFIRLEPGNATAPTEEGSSCPVCDSELYIRPLLDPPAFSPERGRELREGDRDQDMTYASVAQLPELVGQEEFEWVTSSGAHLHHAYGEDVLLIVANKGNDVQGFSICESCGAAWPSDGDIPLGSHARPFLISKNTQFREGASPKCSGSIRTGIFLGHEFRTDILLLRVYFHDPMDFSPGQPWLHDSLNTLSEALALGASLHLSIDPGELSAGYRLVPASNGERGVAEIFLFDTASGGAGYAAEAGADLPAVLDQVGKILSECPAKCDRSCTECLRHYGNRFLHHRLDRHLALELLKYARWGTPPEISSAKEQSSTLAPLARFLELEGWKVSLDVAQGNIAVPLLATSPLGTTLSIGTHPTLLSSKHATQSHFLSNLRLSSTRLLPVYLIERDLPSAYQYVKNDHREQSCRVPNASSILGRELIEVREFDFLALISGTQKQINIHQVRINDTVPDGFAVRIPVKVLSPLGIPKGALIIVRPVKSDDYDEHKFHLICRLDGNFRLTGAPWTVAQLKVITDEVDKRIQISYSHREAQFRPERIIVSQIKVLGAIEVIQDGRE